MNSNYSKYLSISKSDLKASETLFNTSCFPQSIFYAEQAIEKICKYLILNLGILPEEQLRKKVGHNSRKVFVMITDYLIEMTSDSISSQKSEYKDFFNNLKLENELLKNEINSNSENADPDLDTLLNNIEALLFKNAKNPYAFLFDQKPEESIKMYEEMNGFSSSDLEKIKHYLLDPSTKEIFLSQVQVALNNAGKQAVIANVLLYLGKAFSGHWISTRYPISELNKIPTEFYTLDNPLVKRLPKFIPLIERTILELEKI